MPDDITPPEAEDSAPATTKTKRSHVTALVIALGLLGGGAFGAFVAGPQLANRIVRPAVAGVAPTTGAKHEKVAPPAVLLLDNLVLNPAGSGGLRFLLVTVGLQLSNDAATEALKSRDSEVRDVILRIFGNKRVEELADVGNRGGMKREIKVALDSLLAGDAVKGVYFPQFVIQ
jgi:flagellar FliL protein